MLLPCRTYGIQVTLPLQTAIQPLFKTHLKCNFSMDLRSIPSEKSYAWEMLHKETQNHGLETCFFFFWTTAAKFPQWAQSVSMLPWRFHKFLIQGLNSVVSFPLGQTIESMGLVKSTFIKTHWFSGFSRVGINNWIKLKRKLLNFHTDNLFKLWQKPSQARCPRHCPSAWATENASGLHNLGKSHLFGFPS